MSGRRRKTRCWVCSKPIEVPIALYLEMDGDCCCWVCMDVFEPEDVRDARGEALRDRSLLKERP